MNYRREIDGLRAVAVIPVILFHAGFTGFSGGFIGVDVFFVISGYLITTIILMEKERGVFSLVNFYERRARRIIPALFLVMGLSVFASWFWLFPSHMVDFSQSLIAVSFFSSNILFWQETGYWGVENELKPLLHTWSLAVEEQYYVFFPIFLMIMWRFRKRWIFSSFVLVAFSSLLLSQYLVTVKPTANFFLLPTRGWELAIGAGIAFYFVYRTREMAALLSHKLIDEVMGGIGVALIFWAVIFFDESTPFPSVYALIPTIGTALIIIFSNNSTFIGKILGSKILVSIGLISYSAYLWHQPLFVFARHRSIAEPSSTLMFILSLASLLMAFISWRYIESPFRKKGVVSRTQIFSLTIIGSLVFILIGVWGQHTNGFADRYNHSIIQVLDAKDDGFRIKTSLNEETVLTAFGELQIYRFGDQASGRIDFVVWGDSHAEAMLPAIIEAARTNGMSGVFVGRNGCPPFLNAVQVREGFTTCNVHAEKVVDFISMNTSIKKVILISRWSIYAMGKRYKKEPGNAVYIQDNLSNEISFSENKLVFERSLKDTLEKLTGLGLEVIISKQVPETEHYIPEALAKKNLYELEEELAPRFQDYKERQKFVENLFDELKDVFALQFVDPSEYLCKSSTCKITDPSGVPIYVDTNHLTQSYSKILSPLFSALL
jgi:peptidoglycan/LPS O-acetylase OafA/YrhL